MTLEQLYARGASPTDPRVTHGLGGNMKGFSRTLESTNGASINSSYDMGYVPSNARLFGISRLAFDIIGGAGVLLDIGLAPAADANNFAFAQQALNDTIAATAAGSASLIKDIANDGKRAWEYAGLTADPGGVMIIRVTLRGAAGTGGTITAEVLFSVP